jgi:hypothetical protein
MPDEFGYVSLGLSVDIIPATVAKARLVIAEVNALTPHTMGDTMLHVGEIDWLVPVDTPLIEYQPPSQPWPGGGAHRALYQERHRRRLDGADRPGPFQ